ncbi:SulP family inorganic anion transporter [Roseibium sp. FZY0029]|uniref:SulP family inorganic anion transporter n=1 Tax=Roseibium sp. FZY0029 TaxID=3116647 RepID=UPI002EA46ED9|nr:SulP family inorganic anion transporter [Roseibium sp. FZY0029]
MSTLVPKPWCLAGVLPLKPPQILPEVLAGLTLAAIAIPEVMGYTKISGTPVITGLTTLLVPMALFALFGSSRHLVVGADSATAAILATSLAGLAAAGSADYVALAGLLALMVGGLLLVASVTKIAFMADFLSRTVLTGFLSGVGIQVSLHSLGGMSGLHLPQSNSIENAVELIPLLKNLNLTALTVSAAVVAIIVGLKRVSTTFPGAIVALGLATVASAQLSLKDTIAVVGSVPGGLPSLALPALDWSFALVWQLGPTALAMLVVILAQSAATARAYAARYGEQLAESVDLRALGLANLGAGLTGTFVVNGSPTKSQIVDSAGGRTQLSMLVTVAVVLLVLLFFTELLADLPEAALSALVFLIGIELIDLKGLRKIYRTRRPEFWVSVVTIAVVVVAGVGPGIVLAIVLSLIVHTRHGYHPVNILLVREPSGDWQAKPLSSREPAADGLMVYRFSHSMYYANAERMAEEIRALTDREDQELRFFCIDFSCVDDIDFTALETLKTLRKNLRAKGIDLLFSHDLDDPGAPARKQLVEAFGEEAVLATLKELTDYTQTMKAARNGSPASP